MKILFRRLGSEERSLRSLFKTLRDMEVRLSKQLDDITQVVNDVVASIDAAVIVIQNAGSTDAALPALTDALSQAKAKLDAAVNPSSTPVDTPPTDTPTA